MRPIKQSDEQIVENARKVAAKGKLRWAMLLYGIGFLGLCCYFTFGIISEIQGFEISIGLVFGIAIAIIWAMFGVLGALCLGKFVAFQSEFRKEELLVAYHDRLRELEQLPDEKPHKS